MLGLILSLCQRRSQTLVNLLTEVKLRQGRRLGYTIPILVPKHTNQLHSMTITLRMRKTTSPGHIEHPN